MSTVACVCAWYNLPACVHVKICLCVRMSKIARVRLCYRLPACAHVSNCLRVRMVTIACVCACCNLSACAPVKNCLRVRMSNAACHHACMRLYAPAAHQKATTNTEQINIMLKHTQAYILAITGRRPPCGPRRAARNVDNLQASAMPTQP